MQAPKADAYAYVAAADEVAEAAVVDEEPRVWTMPPAPPEQPPPPPLPVPIPALVLPLPAPKPLLPRPPSPSLAALHAAVLSIAAEQQDWEAVEAEAAAAEAAAAEAAAAVARHARAKRRWKTVTKSATVAVAEGRWAPPRSTEAYTLADDLEALRHEADALEAKIHGREWPLSASYLAPHRRETKRDRRL